MAVAEFREKTYEKYFFAELIRQGIGTCYPPDQMAENILGFDDAFFLPPFIAKGNLLGGGEIWKRLSDLQDLNRGITLNEIDGLATEFQHWPNFNLNFFVQYKRPDFFAAEALNGPSEWQRIKKPYYRFSLQSKKPAGKRKKKFDPKHQLKALRKLYIEADERAVITYAAPAFYNADKLWEYVEQKKIIEMSNLAEVQNIKPHHNVYTFLKEGWKGKAFSEPEEITSRSIKAMLDDRKSPAGLSMQGNLKQMASDMVKSIQDNACANEMLEIHISAIKDSIGAEESVQAILENAGERFSCANIVFLAYCEAMNLDALTFSVD